MGSSFGKRKGILAIDQGGCFDVFFEIQNLLVLAETVVIVAHAGLEYLQKIYICTAFLNIRPHACHS
jgi:hypothetical protein